jgi:hypothetical protein
MEELRPHILDTTYVLATAKHRFNLVKDILEQELFSIPDDEDEAVAKKAAPLETRYQTAVEGIVEKADRETISTWGVDWLVGLRASTFNAQVDNMQAWLSSLPLLHLYLPRTLDEDGYALIGKWCRAEMHKQIMFEIDTDPELVGGCAFVKDNVYHEYSLRTQLDLDPELIPDVFKEYANL